MERYIKQILALAFSVCAYALKQYGVVFGFVCGGIILDYATGLINCKVRGVKITSKKAYKGFYKKVALLIALCFGIFLDLFVYYMLDKIPSISISFNMPFGLLIGCYIVVNELISICENLYKINPDILPQQIQKILTGTKEQLKGGNNE